MTSSKPSSPPRSPSKERKEDEEEGGGGDNNGITESEKDKDNNEGEDDPKRRRPWDGEERPFWKRQFSCTLNARGFTYEGKGRTKQDAKNAAAEEASVLASFALY